MLLATYHFFLYLSLLSTARRSSLSILSSEAAFFLAFPPRSISKKELTEPTRHREHPEFLASRRGHHDFSTHNFGMDQVYRCRHKSREGPVRSTRDQGEGSHSYDVTIPVDFCSLLWGRCLTSHNPGNAESLGNICPLGMPFWVE